VHSAWLEHVLHVFDKEVHKGMNEKHASLACNMRVMHEE